MAVLSSILSSLFQRVRVDLIKTTLKSKSTPTQSNRCLSLFGRVHELNSDEIQLALCFGNCVSHVFNRVFLKFLEVNDNSDVASSEVPPVEAVLNPPSSPAPKRKRQSSTIESATKRASPPTDIKPVSTDLSYPSPENGTSRKDKQNEVATDVRCGEIRQRVPSPIPAPPAPSAAAVFPIPFDLVKLEHRPESPAISEASGDEPIESAEPLGSSVADPTVTRKYIVEQPSLWVELIMNSTQ